MKQLKDFIRNFNKCYYVLLAIYHNTLELIDSNERDRTIMATLKELLDGISSDIDSVKEAQTKQSEQITEINGDVDKLHKDLENAGVSQELIDAAQSIKSRLETVKTSAEEATATLTSINDKTAAAQETSPPPAEGDADEDEEDPNEGTALEGSGETV